MQLTNFFKKRTIEKQLKANKEQLKLDSERHIIPEVNTYLRAVRRFEEDRIERSKKSEKLAWRVAFISMLSTLFAVLAILGLTPLKTAVPFLIRVDNNTGYTDLVPQLSSKTITYTEVMNKYWLSNFVIYRESYSWASIQNDFNHVILMSSSNVGSTYNAYIHNQALSPLYILRQQAKIVIRINGVTLLNKNTAQVRFTRIVETKTGQISGEYKPARFIATIVFTYLPNKIKTVQGRLMNPLGFTVISYNVTQEV